MKKLLNEKLNLGCAKLKVPKRGSHWAYASFRNDEDKLKAIEVLNGFRWKGKTLRAGVSKNILFLFNQLTDKYF